MERTNEKQACFFFLCPQERANIINSRLNEETSALAKKQAAFQRNQRDNDANAEEEFEIFCSEAMFRIQVKLKVCRASRARNIVPCVQ